MLWFTTCGPVYSWCTRCGSELHDGGQHAPGCPELTRKPSVIEVTAVDVDEHGHVSITVAPVKGSK